MIIVIDGNIGSGKSTQVEKLSESFDVHREPLDKWGKLLQWFYDNPRRWALTFQMRVLKCFNDAATFVGGTNHLVIERYPESSRCVFWKILCEQDTVTKEEQEIYSDYYKTFTPDVLIYLRCPPSVCLERFKSRGQPGDNKITLEYVTQLHDLYEQMYKEKSNAIVLDGTMDSKILHKHIKDKIVSSIGYDEVQNNTTRRYSM